MNKSKQLIFFGSGPVGLASLEALNKNFSIETIVTKPNPKSSRNPAFVADYAREQGIHLIQPSDSDELVDFISKISFESRVGVVVDYGIIIPKTVFQTFELGIINSHFSILPQWRGADPITFALLSGQSKTGVSIMRIAKRLDTGKLLAQEELDIEPDDNIISLTGKLVVLSNHLLEEVLDTYTDNQIVLTSQDTSVSPSYSRKLTKKDGEIDWRKPALKLEREIRAYLGWPGSYTKLGERNVIITKTHLSNFSGTPGEFFNKNNQLGVYCGEDSLIIERLKPAGKREMTAKEFLAGNKVI